MQIETINAFWIGPNLGAMSIACLRSFMRHGHRVVLHVYDEPCDVPLGVELADAAKLLPRDQIRRYRKSGSHAFAANQFRYEALAAGAGLYVDCDCYCVRPIEVSDYIMGWESHSHICNAVLKLPPGSPLLEEMRAIYGKKAFIPPWASRKIRRKYRLRAAIGLPVGLPDMEWGTTGPLALTHYARHHGVLDRASPPDFFYSLAPGHANLLFEPGLTIEDLTTPRTRIVHLWNEFTRHINAPPPDGSPLAQILTEGS
ncbi:MAG: hypothetical protein P0Y66_03790 [Candidatus Kaistia colombiensis]|nr:MAG: hypothetical protein P0Y66_03790 [Kaistia sp.]